MYLVIDLNLIGNIRKIKSNRENSFLCSHVKLNGIRKMRRKVEVHIDLNILIKAIKLRMVIRISCDNTSAFSLSSKTILGSLENLPTDKNVRVICHFL